MDQQYVYSYGQEMSERCNAILQFSVLLSFHSFFLDGGLNTILFNFQLAFEQNFSSSFEI